MEKALSNSSLRQLKPLKQVSPACSSFLRPLTTAICHDKDLGYVRQWHLTKVGFHPSPHLRVRKMKPRIEVQTISQFHQAHKSVVTAHLPVGIDIGRGPTQKVEVWGMKTGHRLSIQFDDRGQLVGDNSSRQTSFLDTLVRGDNITLVAVPDQRYIDNIAEQRAWKQINAPLWKLESKATNESFQTSPNDIMAHVFGPFGHGRIRGMGFGATPSKTCLQQTLPSDNLMQS